MAWSTSQIAELTGTTVRAVRHYHQVGLLAEPERSSNGYKRYGVAHLVRVLRIKRLTDLGFSLAQIADLGDADEHPQEALRKLDTELAETIERLQSVREELATILRESAPTDLPMELGSIAAEAGLTPTDRSLVVVASRVLDQEAIDAYTEMLRDLPDDPHGQAFEDLPEDASEEARQELAERIAPFLRDMLLDYPNLTKTKGPQHTANTIGLAMRELYNSAQLDVVKRVLGQIGRERGN
ncbi:helix-turn-helix domain-containing protein [Actinoalloteichus hymeniacidonis]|uniref:Transcriptional regulator n=1 Tax=Actinoalloteichus hymeniacidonis TaxID=340345 RepID=A0AAC9HSE1_9PSEU|nr:MerR family transcriptional regulator [Actinoalloteichus hymeniacidonis]AOS64553.1 putative transcriptional regulator [Actinoalloteichus hymeniacidonis]MBB5907375.1 DNA-binding transcriptional MerR regulator [Actinoalloteichus hymeniacidonis]